MRARGPDLRLPFNGTTVMILRAARPQARPEAEIVGTREETFPMEAIEPLAGHDNSHHVAAWGRRLRRHATEIAAAAPRALRGNLKRLHSALR